MQGVCIIRGKTIIISEEMKPALIGVVPATLITSSKEGIPNITNISRVWYVDGNHVAVANHMLKKSLHNLQENPYACIRTTDPTNFSTWELELEYIGCRTDGEVFDQMEKQYEVLSMMLESEPITVHCAEMFLVLSARICEEESSHLRTLTEIYNPLLEQLEKKFGWDQLAVWITEDLSNPLQLAIIRGLDEETVKKVLQRVAQWSVQQEKPVRIFNIRSQYQYATTILLNQQSEKEKFSLEDYRNIHQHYVAIPIKSEDKKIKVVIASQSNDELLFSAFHEDLLHKASRILSQLIEKLQGLVDDKERQNVIEQELDRILLEGSRRTCEKNTVLSPRELQVAIQVARGLSNEEIAKVLFLSKRTVTTHLERIYQKLSINSRAALASYVTENGRSDSLN